MVLTIALAVILLRIPTGTANNGMDYSETNQAEKNKTRCYKLVKNLSERKNGGAFNTVAYKSSKEAYDANVDTVKR